MVFGDILALDVDAIVNPAHAELLGGGGLDGMIHDAAGPELLDACRKIGGCAVGEAVVTPGFRLRASWVVHTVGPIWRGGAAGEDELLASCYGRCLEGATRLGVASIAFPGISTGLHRFPVERAAAIAVREVERFLGRADGAPSVFFVCFDRVSMDAYEQLLSGGAAGRAA